MDKTVYVQLARTKTDQSIEVAAKKAKSDLNQPTLSKSRLLLGLSIEGNQSNGLPDTNAAERILKTLKDEFNSDKGLIDFELPPADADEQIDF